MKLTHQFFSSVAMLCIASCSNLEDLQATRQGLETSIQAHQKAIRAVKSGASIAQLPALPVEIQRPTFSQPIPATQQKSFVAPQSGLAFRYDEDEFEWSTPPATVPMAPNFKNKAADLTTVLRSDQRIPRTYEVLIKPESGTAVIEPSDELTKISVAEWANYRAYQRLIPLRKELTALTGKARN